MRTKELAERVRTRFTGKTIRHVDGRVFKIVSATIQFLHPETGKRISRVYMEQQLREGWAKFEPPETTD